MDIRIGSLIDGARAARGVVIVIDVFRAFTTAAVAFDKGVDRILLTASPEEALELRRQGLGQFCMGEVGGIRPDGFDFGNSPYELSQVDSLAGQTLIQSTQAGTVGVTAAAQADAIYLGSFVMASAIVRAIHAANPPLVSIVAMGVRTAHRSDEDEQCALYLRNRLQGRYPDPDAVRQLVLAGQESLKYDDPAQPQYHPQDRDMALQIDRCDFALRVTPEDGLLVARRDQTFI